MTSCAVSPADNLTLEEFSKLPPETQAALIYSSAIEWLGVAAIICAAVIGVLLRKEDQTPPDTV